ncbi:hypothetical protein roselon_01505 [Roseibacterium elongatum DSM 19469]|uniref:Integral membrane protein n=1 Tax=Roseicyclus elongatus DSM 19469 TaxID=1294273 RepID=W8RRZ6_9RHOB|nr:Pr6Pr family membrane protein [Roseibacterium elongatum]AHM03888.1 hypothetical protein roselon_01505 [Roseibacterium elongatum DSM 19469]
MFPTLTRPARRRALLIALGAWFALLAQWVYLVDQMGTGPVETLLAMTRFFTIPTAALVVVTLAAVNFRKIRGVGAPWLAALTLSELVVAVVYHARLSQLWEPTGIGWWADLGLHTILPGAVLLWWLFDAPKRALVWADLPIFILWPSIYGAYVLGWAAQDGIYPYPFMDVSALGPARVAATLGMYLIAMLLAGVVFIAIGRYADR